jgi:pimeloyl-ACP methyl ester carboxylesterase
MLMARAGAAGGAAPAAPLIGTSTPLPAVATPSAAPAPPTPSPAAGLLPTPTLGVTPSGPPTVAPVATATTPVPYVQTVQAKAAIMVAAQRQLEAAGRTVDVGGYSLYLACIGQGRPTVVLDAPGPDADSRVWEDLPVELARLTRVCVYDRAGQGRSAAGPSGPTTIGRVADELHALLTAAGEPGPYVLAGYSFGGVTTYMFAARYPAETAGLALIDSTHDEDLARWADDPTAPTSIDLRASAAQMRAARPLADFPVVVISRGRAGGPGPFEDWQAWQADLVKRSPRARRVIAERSAHGDILERDRELVVGAIRELVEQARR